MKQYWKHLKQDLSVKKVGKAAASLLLQWVAACLIYFFMEAYSRHSFWDGLRFLQEKPLVFLYNTGFLLVSSILVYLFRRRLFARAVWAIFWIVLGVINGNVLARRVTPFTGPDLRLLGDAKEIAGKYLTKSFILMLVIGLVAVVSLLLVLFRKSPKKEGRLYRLPVLAFFTVSVLGFYGITGLAIKHRVLSTYFGNIAFAYQDYGYPYCLWTTLFNVGIDKPNGYDQTAMEKLADGIHKKETIPQQKPNVIIVQLESFFDPNEVNGLSFSDSVLPYFRRYSKDFSSGYLKVPVVGAGTANTEFEVVSGMSLRYFGPGEYPYKGILKKETSESLAYTLKGIGYATHAIHNNTAGFYGRNVVFPNLGFETFQSKEYMDQSNKTPMGWLKDGILTGEIKKALDSTPQQDFVFTISVQGHGSYPQQPLLRDPQIKVTGIKTHMEEMRYAWEYYANQVHEMDVFVDELIKMLETRGEPTIIAFYGDHLPTMNLKSEDMKNRYLFQTPYLIWDNLGLEAKKTNLATYQLGAEMLSRIGIQTGEITRFHQFRKNTKNYMSDLEMLQYDILYGKRYIYQGSNPYHPTQMRMGVVPITITGLQNGPPREVKGVKQSVNAYVYGKNFTEHSKVFLNGEYQNTIFLSSQMLALPDTGLSDGDYVQIRQATGKPNEFIKLTENAGVTILSTEDGRYFHEKK
ncbi:MAG: LTA synthase family protein [Eubacteriales bacterium]|nr:LTA synthase family protein [Eubacteriales bacterium]